MQGRDRRRYFRVQDNIVLRYREIEESELPASPEEVETELETAFDQVHDFIGLDREDLDLLNAIEARIPEVGQYLRRLERRLENLARGLFLAGDEHYSLPTQQVDISASGIGFVSDEPLESGSLLEMRLIMLPSYLGILTYGRVAHCKPDNDQPDGYQIGTEFTLMRESDREALIQHILRKQMEQIRARLYAEE